MPIERELTTTFRAMNTDVFVVVAAEPERLREAHCALEAVRDLFQRAEAVMSRFRVESELSILNRSAGQPFRASRLLFQVVSEAISAATDTRGLFDPTLLRSLLEAGYDRSFELLPAAAPPSRTAAPPRPPGLEDRPAAPAWARIALDPLTSTITLPPGTGLELGGIGKGWTVDRAATILRSFESYAVDAGGDLYAGGSQPNGSPWTVGVEDPFDPDRDILVLAVRDRAVATSTICRRRWSQAGSVQHHLIDPRTGRPADSGIAAVTVVAGTVARAESLAKAALLLGPDAGSRFLSESPETEWVMVTTSGDLYRSPGLMEAKRAA